MSFDAARRPGLAVLTLGALGVVFGDIGTSPIYAMQTVFALDGGIVRPTPDDVYGVISLVFWSILLIVTLKYVIFVLRADNNGEGGILALATLTRRGLGSGSRLAGITTVMGIVGASLFYGDSVITPAISVLSAIEGLSIPVPALGPYEVLFGVVVIAALFAVQRFGTHSVGRFFGPIMVAWFATLGVLGAGQLVRDPRILTALLPTHGLAFIVSHPLVAFIAMGAVVLSITGAEALYADMGHFGVPAIRSAWFFLALPTLTLNYLGQGALILHDPSASSSPFFLLAPQWAQLPLVILATAATVIASQAVISGAFSVTREAQRLGFLPRLTVRQTSEHEGGQIYLPAVNWLLCAGVLLLVVLFRTSERLATAYGLAVTGTLLLTTTLFLVLARTSWKWGWWRVGAVAAAFGLLEIAFFGANLTKVIHGGWLPLLIAGTVTFVMLTWRTGGNIVTRRRTQLEGNLGTVGEFLARERPTRVPGTAIFLHPDMPTIPLALGTNVRLNKVLHRDVLVVSAVVDNVPHVAPADRVCVQVLEPASLGILRVVLRYGFKDEQNIPMSLLGANDTRLHHEHSTSVYFVSRIDIVSGADPAMMSWRKRLFIWLVHNSASPIGYFYLPQSRTMSVGNTIHL